MNADTKDFLQTTHSHLMRLSKLVLELAQRSPKAVHAVVPELETLANELGAMSAPTATRTNGQAARSLELRPYLAEYAGENPVQVSYDELAPRLGLSPGSLRVRVSQSIHKGFIRRVGGRPVVVLRDPTNLQRVLDERYSQTQNPDDRVVLPKRPPKARGA